MGQEYIRNINILTTLPDLSSLVYKSDFNNGINLKNTVSGFDYVFNLEESYSLFPGFSLRLATRIDNAAAGDKFKIYKPVFLNPSKLIVMDFYMYYPQEAGLKYINFGFTNHGQANTLQANLRHEYLTEEWSYESADGVFTVMDIPLVSLQYAYWHHIQGVFNFNSAKFVELTCDEQRIDISAYPVLSTAPSATLGNEFFVTLEAADAFIPQLVLQKILISTIR